MKKIIAVSLGVIAAIGVAACGSTIQKAATVTTPPVTVTPDAKEENITEATQTDPNR